MKFHENRWFSNCYKQIGMGKLGGATFATFYYDWAKNGFMLYNRPKLYNIKIIY
jgi:hypothetical protein